MNKRFDYMVDISFKKCLKQARHEDAISQHFKIYKLHNIYQICRPFELLIGRM